MLPIKNAKIKITERYFNYLVIQDANQKIQIEKRKGKGIWENLFQFPLVETPKGIKKQDRIYWSTARRVGGKS